MNYIDKEIANIEFLMEDLQEGIWKIDNDDFLYKYLKCRIKIRSNCGSINFPESSSTQVRKNMMRI